MLKGLLKKDLYNLYSYKASLIIILLFCGIAIIGTGQINFGPIIVCVILGMISLATFSYDELAKTNKYLLTLPTNRKEIVTEKYILAIGATILGGVLGITLTIIALNVLNYFRPDNLINIDYESLITTTIGGMWGVSLIQAIQIPSIYKWGPEKGRIQMFVLFFIIIVAVAGIGFLIAKTNFNINMEVLKNFFNQFGLLLLVFLMIIMYYISYKVSYKIYKNKEE